MEALKTKNLSPAEFAEFVKCRNSPAYFLSKYGFIQDPILGKIRFDLFRYQEICLSKFLKHAFNIVLKSRQMGLSWLVAGYALWLCMFFEEKKVLMISIKDVTAKALLKKVKYIYNNLPEFLQVETPDDNVSKLSFATGSEIQSVPTSEEAGRSESLSLLIIDEAAFVRWIDRIWQAAFPTLSTGGAAIVLSTPDGMGNFYADLWHKSIEGRSLFNPIRLHWWYHPKRSKDWYRIQRENMTSLQLAQEVDGEFIASGNLVFDPAALRTLQEECSMIRPVEILHPEGGMDSCGLYIYQKPGRTNYVLCADTALGGSATGDYHGAHVLDLLTGEQVAEYRSQVPLEIFNRRLFDLGLLYNNALAAIENNNMGIATNLYFKQNNYPYVYEYTDPLKIKSNGDRTGAKQLGFPTNTATRPIVIDLLGTCIREGASGIRGIRTVNELFNFAWSKQGKAEALPGKNDDLVISYGIGKYVRAMSSLDANLPMLLM